jgi:hypothetical protein
VFATANLPAFAQGCFGQSSPQQTKGLSSFDAAIALRMWLSPQWLDAFQLDPSYTFLPHSRRYGSCFCSGA